MVPFLAEFLHEDMEAILGTPRIRRLNHRASLRSTLIGAVLCVKWSNGEGKYLATGSDDQIVMIWSLDRYPSTKKHGVGRLGNIIGGKMENSD